jgi:type II secretory pathway predicted ATPase ExeA
LTPDRRYIFETDGFRRAFAMLLAGIRARRGIMLLTGPSGTGKTTLLQGFLGKLQHDGCITFWRFHPDIPGYDLVGSCLAELEVSDAPADPAARALVLAKALTAKVPTRPAVLIVDEAGQFADAQLAELAALPAATGNVLQVVLAGLPAFAERLEAEPLADLRKAITMRAQLGPLEPGELGAYIAHRCRVAGQSGPLVFEPQAIARVFDHTGGTPRLVNRLCATALFFAAPDSKQISAGVVDEAARACSAEPLDEPNKRAAMPPSAQPAAAESPERPRPQESQSEVHRTLAEAERAWIASATAAPAAAAQTASAETAAPVAASGADGAQPAKARPAAADASVLSAKKPRSSALRIAASVAILAGSAAAIAAILWPSGVGREYLAESAPGRAVTRLLVSDGSAGRSDSAPTVSIATTIPKTDGAVPAAIRKTAGAVPAAAPRNIPASRTVEPATVEPGAAAAAVPMPEPAAAPVIFPSTAEPAAPSMADSAPAAAEPASETAPVVAATLSAIEPANGPEPAAEEPPVVPATVAAPATAPVAEPVTVAAVAPAEAAPNDPPAAAPAIPAPAPEPAVAAVPPADPEPAKPRLAQVPPPLADAAELQLLMKRGDDMLRLGDPASARLFYERAASRGLPSAYTAVGRTFDPTVLQRLSIRGGGANGDLALTWYRRGVEAGDADAAKAVSDLTAWLARQR